MVLHFVGEAVKALGSPQINNLWGEQSTSEYLLLKRSFGTYMRIVSATVSAPREFAQPSPLSEHRTP